MPSCALRVAIATMGVLVREEQALPGAAEFSQRLIETDFLVLMNDSMFTPRDLAARLARSGLHAPEASIWTSGGGHGVVPGRPVAGRVGVSGRRGGSEDRAG